MPPRPRTYQVTGPVLDIKGTSSPSKRTRTKWEMLKTPIPTIIGTLAVGAKVKVEYRMTATKITVQ